MKKKGIALSLEAMFFVAFLMVLAGVGIYGYRDHVEHAARSVAMADLAEISGAMSQFRYDCGRYPVDLKELTKQLDGKGPWLPELKVDPWGEDYRVLYDNSDPNVATKFIIFSNHGGRPDFGGNTRTSADLRHRGRVALLGR